MGIRKHLRLWERICEDSQDFKRIHKTLGEIGKDL